MNKPGRLSRHELCHRCSDPVSRSEDELRGDRLSEYQRAAEVVAVVRGQDHQQGQPAEHVVRTPAAVGPQQVRSHAHHRHRGRRAAQHRHAERRPAPGGGARALAAAQQEPGAEAETEAARRMLPQRLAAHRPGATAQPERQRRQQRRQRPHQAARRQEHEYRRQGGQQRGGQGAAVPPPEAVALELHEQVEQRVPRQPEQRRAQAEGVDVDVGARGRGQVVVGHGGRQLPLPVGRVGGAVPVVDRHRARRHPGLLQGPGEGVRRVQGTERQGAALEQVHAEQHVAFLVAAGQEVAVAHVGAEAHREQQRGEEVARRGDAGREPRRRGRFGRGRLAGGTRGTRAGTRRASSLLPPSLRHVTSWRRHFTARAVVRAPHNRHISQSFTATPAPPRELLSTAAASTHVRRCHSCTS